MNPNLFRLLAVCLGAGLMVGCASTPDAIPDHVETDPMIVQWSSNAREAFASGYTARAEILYRQALNRAMAVDNDLEVGNNAYNLAQCHILLGRYGEAREDLFMAEQALSRAGESTVEVILTDARAAHALGQFKEAEQRLDQLREDEQPANIKVQSYILRAQIAIDKGLADHAEGHLRQARGYLGDKPTPALAASFEDARARLFELKQEPLEAGRAYDRRAYWLKSAGSYRDMAGALHEAGLAFAEAGSVEMAIDRLYRSARSYMAQDDQIRALKVIEQAVALEDPEGDPSARTREVVKLFDDIRQTVMSVSSHKP